MPRRRRQSAIEQIRENTPILAMGGSLLATAVLVLNQLATKDYVKEQDKIILAAAYAHSDANKAANLLEIKSVGADVKTNQKTTELILQELQNIATRQNNSN